MNGHGSSQACYCPSSATTSCSGPVLTAFRPLYAGTDPSVPRHREERLQRLSAVQPSPTIFFAITQCMESPGLSD